MKIDHIRFYVEDAKTSRDWFLNKLGVRSVASGVSRHSCIEIVSAGSAYFVLCSALTSFSPAAQFLQKHPAGVSDVAFCVQDIAATIAQALSNGASLLDPIQTEQQPNGCLRWATLKAWGDLTHTFVERSGTTSVLPTTVAALDLNGQLLTSPTLNSCAFAGVDHVVLNVAKGDLEQAVLWYEKVLGFQPKQAFEIQTNYSALCSRVMLHPLELVQLPINEPATQNSQIQEFLDTNRGPGIQHIALETIDLVSTIAQLRQNGLPLIQVPPSYYAQLRQRPQLPLSELRLQAIEAQQILVDWRDSGDRAVLLQTFTQPIFDQPTFFFELIERQMGIVNGQPQRAQGFGEGNFRALFEAIEREQLKRGSLR